ncbi:hypothetical protein SARC_04690 [Sphaeroforma arctica JP610]|uniref:Uncharacterized protein n=1 Tax=Sphaeroforma arctica JP610 TaxID=667725 RepID=A0A0L0G1M0_9EUKA|nr:hypothetical protein SARC_04690 [Sphaeroforma arctica JP610]KNC83042.1 hypothetical protein SARC_04690 [Sphaeroforma arctica JP610]|eukprot:XP_014156944.1 hypothetical protein SARC_04690 [Sphaeroforma arctica JP610]
MRPIICLFTRQGVFDLAAKQPRTRAAAAHSSTAKHETTQLGGRKKTRKVTQVISLLDSDSDDSWGESAFTSQAALPKKIVKRVVKHEEKPVQVGPDVQLWIDRHAPTRTEDLAVHAKKVTEVREWLTRTLASKVRCGEYRIRYDIARAETQNLETALSFMQPSPHHATSMLGYGVRRDDFLLHGLTYVDEICKSPEYESLLNLGHAQFLTRMSTWSGQSIRPRARKHTISSTGTINLDDDGPGRSITLSIADAQSDILDSIEQFD